MIEPMPPEREGDGWIGVCLFFAAFLLMLASGVIRAMLADRL